MINMYISVVVFVVFDICYGQTYMDEVRLLGYLFEHGRYDKSVRPVKNRSAVLQVNISHEVRDITHVDVSAGTFCTYSNLEISWLDEQLTWEPIDHGGIQSVSLPKGKYWTPDFEKPFPGTCGGFEESENFKIENASLTYNGTILVDIYKPIGSLCQIDLTYFPFDEHVCFHQFYSTKYNQHELSINLLHDKIIGMFYRENQEWKVTETNSFVVDITIQRLTVTYASDVITIERRPGFIIINKFLPTCLLSALHSFLPFIPPNSERLSFAITNYLALSFMTISFVADMPRNSINNTVFSYCLLCSNIAASVSVLWSVYIVRLANSSKSARKIPKWLLNRMRRKLYETSPQSVEAEEETRVSETKIDNEQDIGWYEVSMYLDKVYFVTSMFIVVASVAVIWILYTLTKEQKDS